MTLSLALTSAGLTSAGLERAFGLVKGELLPDVIDNFGGISPYHYWDFINNRALYASADVGAPSGTPGWSFTRASVGTAETLAGEIVQFASGELRRTDRGILLEGARTNLFLNSATGVTQDVTVAAVAHTLSFRGTGTITLTGTSTEGPLVGTGANDRVTLTFTPTAGTLTLTVSGSCTNVQLEEGSAASSWIPTAGASVTRAADSLTATAGVSYPLTLFAEIERSTDAGAIEFFAHVDTGSDTERAGVGINASDLSRAAMSAGGVAQASVTVAGALAIGTPYKVAAAFNTNRVQVCFSGTLGTEDTSATLPTNPTLVRFGVNATLISPTFAYLRRIAVFNSALSDANLQTITS